MANNDNEEERLRRVYADKTEGELQVLAADAASLTPEAARALEGEIASRKLDIILSKSKNPLDEVYAPADEPVTIRTFRDLIEARLAKGMLDSAGIPSAVIVTIRAEC
jgi:hypothetical protein